MGLCRLAQRQEAYEQQIQQLREELASAQHAQQVPSGCAASQETVDVEAYWQQGQQGQQAGEGDGEVVSASAARQMAGRTAQADVQHGQPAQQAAAPTTPIAATGLLGMAGSLGQCPAPLPGLKIGYGMCPVKEVNAAGPADAGYGRAPPASLTCSPARPAIPAPPLGAVPMHTLGLASPEAPTPVAARELPATMEGLANQHGSGGKRRREGRQLELPQPQASGAGRHQAQVAPRGSASPAAQVDILLATGLLPTKV